jgi:hypothetical protein
MPERRKLPRKYLMYYTRVYDTGTSQLLGHLVDITPEGAMLVSEKPIPAGADYRLRMELTDDVADEPYLEFDARSLWCRPDVNPRFYSTGFQLPSITPQQAAAIQHIVDSYGFRDN